MSWGVLNLLVLVIYLGLMIYLGVWSERNQKETASGFLLANRSATLPWIIMSVFATGVGTLAYIGTVGMIAEGGVIDLWFEWFWCVGTPLMTLLFVRKMRTSGIISFLDSIAFRFGPKTLLVYISFLVVAVPFSFASMLKGAGLTISDMFPIIKEQNVVDPLSFGAILVLICIAVYLALGGFKACLVTDMLQGILTWAAMIVPTAAVLLILGSGDVSAGWDRVVTYFVESDQQNYLEFSKVVGPDAPAQEYTYSYISAMLVMNLLIIMLPGQFYGSRYMAAATERVARQGPILALILTTVPYGLMVNVTGLAFKAYAPDLPGDELFTGTLRKLALHPEFPMLLSSLLLIALLAAVMGTLDSLLMAKMTDWVRGIYQLWINPKANDRQVVRASRVILGLLVVIAIVAAFLLPKSIWFLQIAIIAITGPISFILIVAAYLIKRSTWQGALAGGLVASTLALFFTAALTGFQGQYEWMVLDGLKAWWPSWLHSQFFTYPIGMAIFWGVNKFYAAQRPEHLERLFSRSQTEAYTRKYGFDRPYVLLASEQSIPGEGFQISRHANELRAYGEEKKLRAFAERQGLRFMPAYQPFVSWREALDQRLHGIYAMGLEVTRQREAEHIGEHERLAGKVLGWGLILFSTVLYFFMFWYFPLRWGLSLGLYTVGSVLMFVGLSVCYEDYEWARRIVDLFGPRPGVSGPAPPGAKEQSRGGSDPSAASVT